VGCAWFWTPYFKEKPYFGGALTARYRCKRDLYGAEHYSGTQVLFYRDGSKAAEESAEGLPSDRALFMPGATLWLPDGKQTASYEEWQLAIVAYLKAQRGEGEFSEKSE